jgi:hypothetical protein
MRRHWKRANGRIWATEAEEATSNASERLELQKLKMQKSRLTSHDRRRGILLSVASDP